MATCIFYIDESGDVNNHHIPLKNGETPLITITGLALPLEEWRNIDREHLKLKSNFYKSELAQSKKRPEHFEIKGNHLAAPRNKNSRRNHVYINEIIELASRYNGKLFCVTIIKNAKNPTSSKSIYTSSLQIIAERFNYFINESHEYDKGIIIIDKNVKLEDNVVKSYMSFIFGNETGRSLTNIHEAPLFADSRYTVGLQLVDNLSSIIYSNHYSYYCNDIEGGFSYEHMRQHWDNVCSLEFKSRKKYEDHIKYGFRTVNHNKY